MESQRVLMEGSQYNEEDQWSQATWSQATTSRVRDTVSSLSQKQSETSQSLDPGSSSTLLTISPNIRAIRDPVFHITAKQFDKYWGYMDSFWVLNSTRPIKDGKLLVAFMERTSRKVTRF